MIRDRIKGLRRVKASELVVNPKNWRTHPPAQAAALRGLLEEIGYADAILARELEDGRLMIVDGHLRASSTPDDEVPVLVLDVSEAEADLMLATLDPLAAMAGMDAGAMRTLLAAVATSSDAVSSLLSALMDRAKEYAPHTAAEENAAMLQQKWNVHPGDLWRIPSLTIPHGAHFVLCADSLDESSLRPLRKIRSVEAVITDPPYELSGADVRTAIGQFADRAIVLSGQHQVFSLVDEQWRHRLDLVWVHRTARSFPSAGQPVHHHNPILLMTRGDVKLGWRRPSPEFSSVIETPGAEFPRDVSHGKTHLLFVEMLRGFLWTNWADPFLGTGGTLLAAETLRRLLYGVELRPEITAVCLERCAAAGLQPVLDASGVPGTGATPTGSRPPRRAKGASR